MSIHSFSSNFICCRLYQTFEKRLKEKENLKTYGSCTLHSKQNKKRIPGMTASPFPFAWLFVRLFSSRVIYSYAENYYLLMNFDRFANTLHMRNSWNRIAHYCRSQNFRRKTSVVFSGFIFKFSTFRLSNRVVAKKLPINFFRHHSITHHITSPNRTVQVHSNKNIMNMPFIIVWIWQFFSRM